MSWEATTPASKGRPKHHAWYKERLNLKFLKTYNPSSALDGERWVFVANDMDDFRTSLPAQTDGSKMVVKSKVNRVPLVNSTSSIMARRVSLQSHTRHPSHNPAQLTLNSKVGPRRQLKEKDISTVEAELMKHPLGLFPHLGDSLPQELQEDVLSILEPQLSPAPEDRAESRLSIPDRISGQDGMLMAVESVSTDSQCDGCVRSNIYHWPLVKTMEEIRQEQMVLASQKVISPAQESKVNSVTHELVQWAKDLGGSEEIHIDEGVVKSLFASDYENKPFLSVPLRVVELTNVPMELASLNKQQSTSSPDHSCNQRAAFMFHDTAGPCLVKTRYGAWYLPVSLWKRKLRNEPLRRPRSDQPLHVQEDETLSNLHGAKAFKEYLLARPGAIIPQFLTEVKPMQL